jgi:DNA-binding transcriptional LysR family regulator
MYPGIELRLQRYAVVLAEELNFTRAAERVHVAQPAFSRSIRQLEDELGLQLFTRSSRRVELTGAGRNFVYEARKALYHAERAAHVSQRDGSGFRDELTVGYSSYIDLDLIKALREIAIPEFPSATITFEGGSPSEILSSIRRGDWQCGLVVLPIDEDRLSVIPLFRLPLAAAVPKRNALSRRPSLSAGDLMNQSVVIPAKRVNPTFHAWLLSKFADVGLKPKDFHAVSSPHEAQYLASQRAAIAIANAGAFRESPDGIVVRRLESPGLETQVAVVTKQGTRTILLSSFIDRVVRLVKRRGDHSWKGRESA